MSERGAGEPAPSPKSQDRVASSSHTIRLHGPWKCELCNAADATSEIVTVQLPVDWSSFLRERIWASMIWKRSFGRPTNLGDRERVELVISNLRGDVIVVLNEVPLEPIARTGANTRFAVTDRLEVRNQLVLEIRAPSSESPVAGQPAIVKDESTAGPFGQVYLEIFTSG
ncbi:MAG: hypothetical protein ABI614_11995 [Planctomycetota bacterium]